MGEVVCIKMPSSISSNFDGYNRLINLFSCYQKADVDKIEIDFRANAWFEANLLPIVYAYVDYGSRKFKIISVYIYKETSKLHQLFIRNGFAKLCFNMEYQPKWHETVVPFKVFRADNTYDFATYIDAEIVRYFPKMENSVMKALSSYIQELFGNAQIHGICDRVFTCGQYYHQNHKMDFTIVNTGVTIGKNVVDYLNEYGRPLPENNISWAVQPANSTKRTSSGGWGLSLMQEFIFHNNGKYQIISGNEFWELNCKKNNQGKLDNFFPGTIINIEIDQSDNAYYRYKRRNDEGNIF